MRRNPICHTRPAILLLIGLLITGVTAAVPATADHDTEPTQATATPSQLASPVPSLLQVTGTTNRFNITASHADVLSVLKAIFEQSHQQFVPDTSVNGEVTLVLNGQPFSVVLASVCKQTFLRYELDKNGIFQFKRDDQAVREGFARIRVINGEIAQQLQRLGYTLAPSGQNGNVFIFRPGISNGVAAGGGFGGGGNIATKSDPGTTMPQTDSADNGAKRGLVAPLTRPQSTAGRDAGTADAPTAAGAANRPATPNASGQASSLAISPTQEPLSEYDQMLRDNGLVGIHVPKDQPLPIAEALKRFSRQANVPILVDPQLQGDHPLRFYGNLVRPLPDALNLLLPAMHLEWRYTGNTIFVTESPDFAIFYGVSNLPKAVYPANGLLQQAPARAKSATPPPDSSQQGNPRPVPKPANGDNG
jgi:hypothetical protein